MKIAAITVWALPLPLAKPYWLSGGRLKFECLDSTFVRIRTDEGLFGFGEACPWGHTYLPAHGGGVRAALTLLAPALIGRDPLATDTINRRMDETLPGHLYAKAALDIACWDIFGKAANLPLWKCLGGEAPAPVPLNSSLSTDTPAEMVAAMQAASAAGYRTHSAKIGGSEPAADIARINALEEARAPQERITYDINRAWTPGVALEVLGSVACRGWIEQPCETLEQCAAIAAKVAQPIMLDECLHTVDDHLRAHRLRAGAGCKLKPNRVGGLGKARFLRDFAVHIGWQMHIEDVGGTAFADTVAIHLAAATPSTHRLASWLCQTHLASDPLAGQGVCNDGGFAVPPDSPGVGIIPDEATLGAFGTPVAEYQ